MTKHKTDQMVPFDYRWIDAQDPPDLAKLESISTFLIMDQVSTLMDRAELVQPKE